MQMMYLLQSHQSLSIFILSLTYNYLAPVCCVSVDTTLAVYSITLLKS